MDRHNDGPDNELSHLSRQGSNVDLLPGEDEHHEVRSSAPYPRFRGFLRQFRLGFLAIAFGRCLKWRSNNEYRKVAIHHSRTIAVTHGLLHLVPLGGAITILMLQWTSYLASFTRDDSTTLQFVAKLHELFMQASIVEIIFCLVLTQAIDGFVPLGLLSGTVQATQLAYIWSLDYLSIYKSSGFRGWRRAIFAISIPALILLISLVGPSSAILMIPKPGSSCDRNAVTKYTRDSTETMHPTLLDLSNGLSIDAASLNLTVDRSFDGQLEPPVNAGSPTRRKSYLNRDSFMPTREPGSQKTAILISDRTLRLSSRWAYTYVEHQVQGETDRFYIEGMQVNTTIPTWYSADSFQDISNFTARRGTNRVTKVVFPENGTATVKMAYPVVITQCWSGLVPLKPDAKLYYNLNGTEMPPDLSELAKYSTLGDIAEELSSSSERLGNVQLYAPVWLPSPWPASPSLFAVFISHEIGESGNASQSLSWYLKERDQFSRRSTVTVTACTLSAFWEFGEVQLQQTSTEETVKTMSYPKFLTQEARPVTLNVTHIDTIRRAGFHRQLLGAVPSLAGDGQHPFERSHMPFSLGAIFALGISKIPDMEKHYSANASLFEQGELVWFPPPGVDPANTTMFKFTLTDYGYGYGTRSTSVYLAMTVISIYCVITIIYISYTIITGFSVTAWNSGIELVMLALQSKRPDYLGHTSVGIDSIKTFGESVGIRVNADDELELVFAHDRDFEKRGLRKIERNKEY